MMVVVESLFGLRAIAPIIHRSEYKRLETQRTLVDPKTPLENRQLRIPHP